MASLEGYFKATPQTANPQKRDMTTGTDFSSGDNEYYQRVLHEIGRQNQQKQFKFIKSYQTT
jgi:hypothetical protein